MQHSTDNIQEDASTCVMQQETHGTATFRVRRAAVNQQHARSIVLDNQCATRHRRHTVQDERSRKARAPRGSVGLAALDLGRRPHSSLSAKVESSFDKLFAPTAERRFTLLRFGDFLTFR